jgi:hypothetical protein
MTELTSAIVSHDHDAIEKALASNAALANERVNGWLPLEWAERTGNIVTLVRTARLINHEMSSALALQRLKQYVTLVSATEYEPIAPEAVAEMVWTCVFAGATFKVDRWKRPFIASKAQAEDIGYLIARSGISSPEHLKAEVTNQNGSESI